MTPEKIKEVLENHTHWIYRNCDGWEGMKADLRLADLDGVDLAGKNLNGANLSGANLCGANMYRTSLWQADLSCSCLQCANLTGAKLYAANLSGANLTGANLRGANFRGAFLRGTCLMGANLQGASLRDADLQGADFTGANIYGIDLEGAKNIPAIPMVCPEEGSFTAWKKVYSEVRLPLIAKLEIPTDAYRSSAGGRKCRASKAKVISINFENGDTFAGAAHSAFDWKFLYKAGETVEEEDFNTDRWVECSRGIHFFMTREEAVQYIM